MAGSGIHEDGRATPASSGLGIRTWTLVASIVALVPLLLFAAWIVVALVHKDHAADDSELLQRSQAAANAVQRRFDLAESALQALAASPAVRQRDFKGLYDQAQIVIAHHPDATAISMVERDGRQLFTTAAPWGQSLPPSGATSFEDDVFRQAATAYTPLFVGSITHRKVMAVSVPVQLDGQTLYSLRMSIPTDALSAVLREQVFPPDWTAAVIDPHGVIAGRSADATRLVGRPATDSLQRAIKAHGACPYETVTYDGAQLSSCIARLVKTDWVVAVGVPTGAFEKDLRESLIKLLAAGVASLFVSISGAVLVANAIRRQMKSLGLSISAEQDAAGDGAKPTIRELAAAAKRLTAFSRREGELRTLLTQAKHDELTGLPSRALFRELVELDLAKADESIERTAMLYIDLDSFKAVNDSQGHEAGDRVLIAVADVIKTTIRSRDVAARLGGDEFAVYLRGMTSELQGASEYVARRLIEQIAAATGSGCSVGIAIGRCDASSLDTLLNEADRMLLRAKSSGKGRFAISSLIA